MQLSPNTRARLIWRGGKKVRAHRWIMEQHLGRELAPDEHVHHKNGNPLDKWTCSHFDCDWVGTTDLSCALRVRIDHPFRILWYWLKSFCKKGDRS